VSAGAVAAEAPARPPAGVFEVASWVVFDLATTVFSYVVLTRYFNEWIVIELNQPDYLIGLVALAVALALVIGLPFFGALADRAGRHKPLLAAFTVASVAGTAVLGVVDSVGLALVVAGVAIFAFNSAEAQYHPLLGSVAAPRWQSFVSGLGIAIGYAGTLIVIGIFLLFGGLVQGGNQGAFVPAAGLYLAFALPCLLFVRDRRPRLRGSEAGHGVGGVAREAMRDLVASLRRARGHPHGRLLVARFLYVDAIATIVAFMTVYARRTGDFASLDLDALLLISTAFAIAGAVAAGIAVSRVGPRPILLGTIFAVAVALLVTGVSGSSGILWVAAPVVGAALGIVAATDRVFMLRLVPAERRGDAFGLYALIGRVSNGFGPLVLWAVPVYVLSELLAVTSEFGASRVSVCLLAAATVLGAIVLRPLPNPRAAEPAPAD
jgi:UMF1 family MFS transporter